MAGVPNRLTASVKEAILAALEDAGGAKYLVGVARENPQVFCALLGKLLPNEITGADGGAIEFRAQLSAAAGLNAKLAERIACPCCLTVMPHTGTHTCMANAGAPGTRSADRALAGFGVGGARHDSQNNQPRTEKKGPRSAPAPGRRGGAH